MQSSFVVVCTHFCERREKERADLGVCVCARVQRQKRRGVLQQISERVCKIQTVMFGKNVHTATPQHGKGVLVSVWGEE